MPRSHLILVVALLSAFGLIASDVYLPAMPAMANEFHIADWQMPQTVSVYLLVLAFAQLAYGWLSDSFGRKPVLVIGTLLYIAGSLGCASSAGFASFLAWRMLEALGAASGLVIGRAVIADTCDKQASAKIYSVVYPLVSLSPALAPAVGGYLAVHFGWRTDFLFVALFGTVALAATLFLLPETRPAHASAGNPFRGFSLVLRDRSFIHYTLVVCAIYSAWFVYLTQSPFLFEQLGVTETASGWLYMPLTCGIIAANLLSKRYIDRIAYDDIVGIGVACFVAGGSAFALAAFLKLELVAAVVLPMFVVSLANGSSLSLAVSGAISAEHRRAATASGLVGFFQIGCASLVSMGVSAAFGTGYKVLAASVLVLGLIAAAAIVPRVLAGRRNMEQTAP